MSMNPNPLKHKITVNFLYVYKCLVTVVVFCLCVDHATELRNARARIRDLEAAASAQRAEVVKF